MKVYSKKKFRRILDNKIIRLKLLIILLNFLSHTVTKNILFYKEINGKNSIGLKKNYLTMLF